MRPKTRIVAFVASLTAVCLAAVATAAWNMLPGVPGAGAEPQVAARPFLPKWATAVPSHRTTYWASGIVEALDRTHGSLTIDHGPGQSMGWPLWLGVRYVASDASELEGITVGDRVLIEFRKRGADYEVIAITPG